MRVILILAALLPALVIVLACATLPASVALKKIPPNNPQMCGLPCGD